jgi:hypothetical protein
MHQQRKAGERQHLDVAVGVPGRKERESAGTSPDVHRFSRPVVDRLLDAGRTRQGSVLELHRC